MPQNFQRDPNGTRIDLKGINCLYPPDLMPPGKVPYALNVRAYIRGGVKARSVQDSSVATLATTVHSLRRLNDLTPAGPVDGYIYVGGAGTKLYKNSVQIDGGYSGNPLSLVPFRPNASVQPWMYVGDSNKMSKVRSDGTCYKMGIAEPQTAPTVSFVGGGTGVETIYYRYIYRSSETGAKSNPSPESIGGTNAGSSDNGGAPFPAAMGPNTSYNASQWELAASITPPNENILRTTGATDGTPQLLDYVYFYNMGLSVPVGIRITGVKVILQWNSQRPTSATLTKASLFYNGVPYGTAKYPGTVPQVTLVDTSIGSSSDTWEATLTPDILNDSTFGFGVQISTAGVRLFIQGFQVYVYYENQDADVTAYASSDPQVDKIDYYRMGGGLNDFTYIGTGPNPPSGAFSDTLNDAIVAVNPLLEFDNYEPFPSIDLPKSGTVQVSAGAVSGTMKVEWVSGDKFNERWLPGTVIIIGGIAYTFYNRPIGINTLYVILPDSLPTVTTNLSYEIAEPILAAQPLPSLWGPTDNVNFMFGCNDPLRPGVLYWTKGNNPDSAPDTNQQDVTSPSEPLMNGRIVNGIGIVFSTERGWMIWPNFFNSLATVTGNVGSAWTLQESISNRGLYIRNAIAVDGGGNIFFRAKDGIYISPGGQGAKSITDDDIYNLFPHEGYEPQAINLGPIYPPDDSTPENQSLSVANGYLYYDYLDVNSIPRTLVFDIAAMGWVVDRYQYPVTVHALEEGPNVNATVVGCNDGTVRELNSNGAEVETAEILMPSFNAGDTRAVKLFGDTYIEATGHAAGPPPPP